jgi:HD-GYP domain-containing protein (c-di-GMP phosphodiesterase class II)
LFSAHIALQHHERWDGKGYPRGLTGEDIHEYARIVAVADVYDALLADRPYRSGYTVNQALTIMKRMAGIHLDPKCLMALIANIAIYPIGSLVELNNGSIGIVVDVNKEIPTRPVVKILYDPCNRRLHHGHEVDLSKLSTILIIRSLSEADFAELLAR